MSNHNGHNPHDAIAAAIVAKAIPANQMPAQAKQAVRGALRAAGIAPPAEPAAQPGKPPGILTDAAGAVLELGEPARQAIAAIQDMGAAAIVDSINQAATERHLTDLIDRQKRAVLLSVVRDNIPDDQPQPSGFVDLGDRLQGFNILPTEDQPGFQEYELDGKPIIQFFSPEVAVDEEGGVLVNLRYRIAS